MKFILLLAITSSVVWAGRISMVKQATNSAREVARFLGHYRTSNLVGLVIQNRQDDIRLVREREREPGFVEKIEHRFGQLPPGLSMQTVHLVKGLQLGDYRVPEQLGPLIASIATIRMEPLGDEWHFDGQYPYQGPRHQQLYERYLAMAQNPTPAEANFLIESVLFTERFNFVEIPIALMSQESEELNYNIVRYGMASKRIFFGDHLNLVYITTIMALIQQGQERVILGVIHHILASENWEMAKLKMKDYSDYDYAKISTSIMAQIVAWGTSRVKIALIEEVLPRHRPSEYEHGILEELKRDEDQVVREAVDHYLRTTFFEDIQHYGPDG